MLSYPRLSPFSGKPQKNVYRLFIPMISHHVLPFFMLKTLKTKLNCWPLYQLQPQNLVSTSHYRIRSYNIYIYIPIIYIYICYILSSLLFVMFSHHNRIVWKKKQTREISPPPRRHVATAALAIPWRL